MPSALGHEARVHAIVEVPWEYRDFTKLGEAERESALKQAMVVDGVRVYEERQIAARAA